MTSRFSALACAFGLSSLLPAAGAFAQETPSVTRCCAPTRDDEAAVDQFLFFGHSVALSGPMALVGIPGYFDLGDPPKYSGRVGIYTEQSDGTWPRTASLQLENQEPIDNSFGQAMASHGKRLAVASALRIHLYERHGSEWQAQAIIEPRSVNGFALELTGPLAYDGETLAFQRRQSETDPVTGLNRERQIVELYRIGPHGEATPVQALPGPLGHAFGNSLAVRGDTLVVSNNSDGAAYVYRNDHGHWRSEQKLSIVNPQGSGYISGVAIHGRHILAGVPDDESVPYPDPPPDTGSQVLASGAVYVFTKSQGRWRQGQRVRPDYNDPQIGLFLGFGGTLAAAGQRVAIGAPVPIDNDNDQWGHTYVYRWDGDTLVFDVHLANITPTTLGMTPRRLIVGTATNDSHGNSVEGAVAVDFGDRNPTGDEDD